MTFAPLRTALGAFKRSPLGVRDLGPEPPTPPVEPVGEYFFMLVSPRKDLSEIATSIYQHGDHTAAWAGAADEYLEVVGIDVCDDFQQSFFNNATELDRGECGVYPTPAGWTFTWFNRLRPPDTVPGPYGTSITVKRRLNSDDSVIEVFLGSRVCTQAQSQTDPAGYVPP